MSESRRASWVALALAGALGIAIAGGAVSRSLRAEHRGRTVGYSVFWGTNPFLVTMLDGARAAAEEWKTTGHPVDIVVTNGGDTDKTRQVSDLEDLFAQGVDGLLVFPGDSVLVAQPVKNLYNKEGLPVVVTDIGLREGKVESFIITDNYAGGTLAGVYMASLLPKGAKVITLDFAPTNDNGQIRQKGFEDKARELGLDVLPEFAMAPVLSLENGQRATEDLLVAEPAIAGIFSFNQVVVQGAYAALQAAGRTDVKLAGFDLDPVSYRMVKEGKIDALVVQDPWTIGHDGMNQMMKVLCHEPVEPVIRLGTRLLTKDNASEFAQNPQVIPKT
jgi:ribose transport system substrate-binding protein